MTIRIIRAGEHIQHIPGYGVTVRESGVAVAESNWWEVSGETCVIAYQPKGAASQAASYTNLANPETYDASPTGSDCTWSAGVGWSNFGANPLSTGWVPTKNAFTIIIRYNRTASSGWGPMVYAYNAGYIIGLYAQDTATNKRRYEKGGYYDAAVAGPWPGVMAISYDNAYLDGSIEKAGIGTGWGSSKAALKIGASNTASDLSIQAMACYSTEFTEAQIAALTILMNAL